MPRVVSMQSLSWGEREFLDDLKSDIKRVLRAYNSISSDAAKQLVNDPVFLLLNAPFIKGCERDFIGFMDSKERVVPSRHQAAYKYYQYRAYHAVFGIKVSLVNHRARLSSKVSLTGPKYGDSGLVVDWGK